MRIAAASTGDGVVSCFAASGVTATDGVGGNAALFEAAAAAGDGNATTPPPPATNTGL